MSSCKQLVQQLAISSPEHEHSNNVRPIPSSKQEKRIFPHSNNSSKSDSFAFASVIELLIDLRVFYAGNIKIICVHNNEINKPYKKIILYFINI